MQDSTIFLLYVFVILIVLQHLSHSTPIQVAAKLSLYCTDPNQVCTNNPDIGKFGAYINGTNI
jgi:hypothetical protein